MARVRLEWSEKKPIERGWYIWFREEYDTFRREFVILDWPAGDQGHQPENLRAYPGNKPIEYIVGGVWYGPIPEPPLSEK